MEMTIGTFLLLFTLAQLSAAQTTGTANPTSTKSREATAAAVPESPAESYAVFNATPTQEAALRAQIRVMHPEILPLRVFLPHWKYLDAARTFQLHIPIGYGSLMFTHLPSRTVFIDNDRYQGEEWLGYWVAHELGHLKHNTAGESDAERGAREFRRRLKEARNKGLL